MRLAIPPLTACLLTTATSLLAPALAAQGNDDVFTLDEVIVSAAGVGTDPRNAPASVTVVTGEQLATGGFSDLGDALRNVPGVSVTGGADAENIHMRGLPGEYTLILVDGKRQNTRESRTNGSGGIDHYYIPPVSAIDRIEVVRGPMSSLHGSDAMGGVINIITKAAAQSWGGSVTTEFTAPQNDADSAQRQLSFFLSGSVVQDTLGLQIWGRRLSRDGSTKLRGPGNREISDLHAKFIWTPVSDHEITFELGRTEIDTDPRVNTRNSVALGYAGIVGGWDVTANLFVERGGRVTTGSPRAPEIANSLLDIKASREVDWNGLHKLTFGAQYAHAALSDQNPGLGDGLHYEFTNAQWALFVEDIWELSPEFSLTLGARYTDDQRFGGKLTPRAYALWNVTPALALSAGISAGYRTPELRQAAPGYYTTSNRGAAVIAGTPTLAPEESTSFELGLRYATGGTTFNATAFQTEFKNKIDSRDTGTTTTINGTTYDLYEYYNVGAARLRGLELGFDHALGADLALSGSYTYTRSERLTGALLGVPLSRTPEHQASLRLDWQTPNPRLNIWGAAQYFGESVSVSSTSRGTSATGYDAFTTLDIGASYALNDRVTLKATVHNVTDTDINFADHGTVQNGRTLWVALSADF